MKIKIWVISILILFTVSCQGVLNTVTDKNFENVVGKTVEAKVNLFLCGATHKRGGTTIDSYSVSWLPCAGSEYLVRKVLPTGSMIRVREVEICEKCFFRGFVVHIEIIHPKLELDKPLGLGAMLKLDKTSNNYFFDPKYFRLVSG